MVAVILQQLSCLNRHTVNLHNDLCQIYLKKAEKHKTEFAAVMLQNSDHG